MSARLPSLSTYLLRWVAGVVLVLWSLLTALAWQTGHHEAQEIVDGQLIAVARLWRHAPTGQTPAPAAVMPPQRVRDYVQDMAVLRWVDDSLVSDTHGLAPVWPAGVPDGLSDLVLSDVEGPHPWRAYQVRHDGPQGRERLVVLLNREHSVDLGRDLAEHTMLPALLLLPLALALLAWAAWRGLRPLQALSRDIAALDVGAGQRLRSPHRFAEFDSTVRAIDQLVERLASQVARERAFSSDLAHELRTPLAALSLQARALSRGGGAEAARAVEAEALRAGAILSQLQALARAEKSSEQPAQPVELAELARRVLADFGQQALALGHELELLAPDAPVRVRGAPLALELALRNLVDNALRHTPAGSRVSVQIWQDAQTLGVCVRDWPPSEPVTAPAPAKGLGLGLRLVQRLAAAQGARLVHAAGPGRRDALVWPQPGSSWPDPFVLDHHCP